MADDRGTVHQIAWQDVFPSTILLSTLRLALSFRALLFATVGFAVMSAGWTVIGKAFPVEKDNPFGLLKESFEAYAPWYSPDSADRDRPVLRDPAPGAQVNDPDAVAPPTAFITSLREDVFPGPFIQTWRLASLPFVAMMSPGLTFTQFAYLLAISLWTLATWAFFGGAISRMAAVSLAREETVSIGQAVSFTCSKWASYFTAPLFPLLGALLLSVPLALLGLLLRFNLGIVVAGILWPIVLVLGLLMAMLLVVLFFGWPLMWGTISTEGTDSFDALSRSYAYTCQRPLHYLLYAVLATVLSAIAFAFVVIFTGAVIDLSHWGVSWGSGGEWLQTVLFPPPDSTASPTGTALISFWIGCVYAVTMGFRFSFLWVAATAIYLLLRRLVDSTETDEVYMPEQEQLFGMPPLKQDSAGVPSPADVANNGGAE